jgi:manganese/zinc/iron transport system permease protein
MTMVAFDPGYAATIGIDTRRIDLATMGLVMAVTVIGLKIVGLIMVIALVIIPPVAARFWSERSETVALIAGVFGGLAGYLGAAISASAPDLPTGPIIVLVAFGIFVVSLLVAPARGTVAAWARARRYHRRVHLRQGLLAMAQGLPVHEAWTLRLLVAEGLARADGVPTEAGRARAVQAMRDERRWAMLRGLPAYEAAASLYDGLRDIETVLTPDQLADIDARMGGVREVRA